MDLLERKLILNLICLRSQWSVISPVIVLTCFLLSCNISLAIFIECCARSNWLCLRLTCSFQLLMCLYLIHFWTLSLINILCGDSIGIVLMTGWSTLFLASESTLSLLVIPCALVYFFPCKKIISCFLKNFIFIKKITKNFTSKKIHIEHR